MNEFNNLTRRELLKISGLSIAGITFLAACGAQSGVTTSPNIASAGTVPPTTALGEVVITDTVLLRTAASLEYNAIDAYTKVLDGGLLTGDFASLKDAIKRFRDDHIGHAAAINALVVSHGGKAHECANTRVNRLYVDPALKLITADGNADAARDAVTLAHALENLATQTYQGVVALLVEPSLRGSAMRVGQDEARHAVVLAQVLNPGYASIGPTTDEVTGKAKVASVPSAYGSLSSIQISIGAPNSEGVKQSLSLETPSLNGLVYDEISC
jgi:rubrerythrin